LIDKTKRRELARKLLVGYTTGPSAATEATTRALAKLEDGGANAVALVEGISDQIALETLAVRHGRDLDAEGVVILPIGGAQAIGRYLRLLGPEGADLTIAGFCDAGEEAVFRRGLIEVGPGAPQTRVDMERLGFHVCVEDLEDELIRALGATRVEQLFDSQGDLGSFRTMQGQPFWRGQKVEAQMRRWLGSGATRKLRYSRLLVESLDLDRVPHALEGTLASI